MKHTIEITISLKDDEKNTLTKTTITIDPLKVPPETFNLISSALSKTIDDGIYFSNINSEEEGE